MNTTIVVVIVIIVVAVVLIASVTSEFSRRRLARAQGEPESGHGRVSLRTLPPEARRRYRDEWNGIEQRFGDVPAQAVQDADRLVQVIMRDIGYPVDDFEHRAADLSADHPQVVRRYRSAHSVAAAQRRGPAEAEPLRQAAGDYRVLVDELLEQGRG